MGLKIENWALIGLLCSSQAEFENRGSADPVSVSNLWRHQYQPVAARVDAVKNGGFCGKADKVRVIGDFSYRSPLSAKTKMSLFRRRPESRAVFKAGFLIWKAIFYHSTAG